MVPAHISIVTLGVADLHRSVEFYSALGWEKSTAGGDEIAWFKLGGCALGLFPRQHLAADAAIKDDGPAAFSGVTLAINLPAADGVQPALEAAAQAGGTILKPATKADWGGVSGYFADPDGHAWEVAWNPFFPLRDNGSIELP